MSNISQNRAPTQMSIKVDTARQVDYDYDQPEVSALVFHTRTGWITDRRLLSRASATSIKPRASFPAITRRDPKFKEARLSTFFTHRRLLPSLVRIPPVALHLLTRASASFYSCLVSCSILVRFHSDFLSNSTSPLPKAIIQNHTHRTVLSIFKPHCTIASFIFCITSFILPLPSLEIVIVRFGVLFHIKSTYLLSCFIIRSFR